MSDVLLRARDAQRSYRGVRVVDVRLLEIHRAEIVALLGPNGSGKSTLFRMMLGLEEPNAGSIEAFGRTAGVFQNPFLFRGTVRQNIAFACDDMARVERVAADFGITHLLDLPVRKLSGGEAQRVALARALVLDPAVLLLDEPTASLDIMIKRTFRDDLARISRAHAGAVLLITHDPAEAFSLADRVCIMDRGQIVETGTPDELLENPKSAFMNEVVAQW